MASVPSSGASDAWTIRRVLAWATDDFRARGIESPKLEAELLLSVALGIDRVGLVIQSQRPLDAEELSRYKKLIVRRRGREPVAYILGQREFYGLPFRVDARVLIPRPDTETLVETALERTASRDMYGRAVDLCTGSGCVAIAFGKQRPTWHVLGVDTSLEALELARENARRLSTSHNVSFVIGDLFEPLETAERRTELDLITANPPYIPSAEIETLAPEVGRFEPRLALDGGEDGLDLVRQIVARASGHLRPEGVLALEIAYNQGPAVRALFEEQGFRGIEVRKDYGGRDRVVSGTRAV